MRCQALDGVAPLRPLGNFLAAAVLLWVAEVMPVEAVRLAFQEGWSLAPPRARNGLASRFVHRESVHAIDLHPGNAVGRCHVGDIRHQGHVLLRGPLGILVVLTDVHHGQLPDRSNIDILMEWTTVRGTVAKEADGHLSRLAQLRRQTSPGGQSEAAGDNAVGAQHTDRKVGNVHGATLALTIAGSAAKEFGHHLLDIGALGDAMAVATVRTGDIIGLREMRADGNGHGFLANVRMQGAHDFALAGLVFRLFLEQADAPHARVDFLQQCLLMVPQLAWAYPP